MPPRLVKRMKDQFRPLIEQAGLNATAEKAGIARGVLSQWLNDRTPSGSSRPRRLLDDQLERLAAALGVEIVLVTRGSKSAKAAEE